MDPFSPSAPPLSRAIRFSPRARLALGLVLLFSAAAQLLAQIGGLELEELDVGPGKPGRLRVESSAEHYYILYHSEKLENFKPIGMRLGTGEPLDLTGPKPASGPSGFYYVEEIPIEAPRDIDQDGLDDVYELKRAALLNPLNSADAQQDPDGNGRSHLQEYTPPPAPGIAPPAPSRSLTLRRDPNGVIVVRYDTHPNAYYALERTGDLRAPWQTIAMGLEDRAFGEFSYTPPADQRRMFFRVAIIDEDDPQDFDGDGMDDLFELSYPSVLNPLDPADAFGDLDNDGLLNAEEYRQGTDLLAPRMTTVLRSSPSDGEDDVAISRESFVKLTGPLAEGSIVTEDHLYAEFGGERLPGRIQLSAGRDTITLFYTDLLPASAVIRVTFDPSGLLDSFGRALDGNGDGEAGGTYEFSFETLTLTRFPGTAICGRIFASTLGTGDNGEPVNEPLEGVTITVDGLASEGFAVTDQFGDFRLDDVPAGEFFVHIDGRTAVGDIPPGAYYPNVGKKWTSVLGEETNVEFIYLPLIPGDALEEIVPGEDTVVQFGEDFVTENPQFDGVQLMVPANSLQTADGSPGGMVGIAPVNPDRLPGTLPPWVRIRDVITIQTDGGTNFDTPAPITLPNLPDPVTGELKPPGAKTALWSFNHDTGQFEIVGSMTISADGRLAVSDPGVGILAPGWHGAGDGTEIKNPLPDDGNQSPDPPPPPPPCPKNGYGKSSNGSGLSEILGTNAFGDPVYTFSGEFTAEADDLYIRGVGFDFLFRRTYRSRLYRQEGRISTAPHFGHGWDHSYNIRLICKGRTLILCSGGSRFDYFSPIPKQPNKWSSNGRFEEITRDPETGDYTLTRADGGKWVFRPPVRMGSPAEDVANLRFIIDRNGNRMTFVFEDERRLAVIADTLQRPILFRYNDQGLLSEIEDFAGRIVRYDYYGPGEAGGNSGDLKSVTSPAVTGTPHGNDFPNGKKVTYTYTKLDGGIRWPEARREAAHNLLTITDGRRNDPNDPTFGEGPFLENTYDRTLGQRYFAPGVSNPFGFRFDRVTQQIWGGASLQFAYHPIGSAIRRFDKVADGNSDVPAAPGPPAPPLYVATLVNDRKGHIKEFLFDGRNQRRGYMEYTGRADPQTPTRGRVLKTNPTPEEIDRLDPLLEFNSNPPANPVRGGDPNRFATAYGFDAENYKATKVRYPNRNEVVMKYDGDTPRTRGNTNMVTRKPGPVFTPVSDQPEISTSYAYNTDRGACCGLDFVTRGTDGRGNSWRNDYDLHGNLIKRTHRISSITEEFEYDDRGRMTKHVHPENGSGHRRVDLYTYYGRGRQEGYLMAKIVDAEGLALATMYEYDRVGNITRITDPNGNDTEFVVNELNQVVRIISREVTPDSGIRYQRDFYYDANNNITRIDVQNVDDTGALQPNSHFTTTYEYDDLNYLVRKSEEVDEDHTVVTEYEYDANRNLTLVRKGEATSGGQPFNLVRYEYDERDLLYREIRGAGSFNESTTQYDYDGNKNLIRIRQGLEDGTPHTTALFYDGYDRLVRIVDPMDNERIISYDANDNIVAVRVEGQLLDEPGSFDNVRLSELSMTYDAKDRLLRRDEAFFNAETQEPIGDGLSTTTYTYSDFSQVLTITNDNNHATTFAYDTVNRIATATDAKGNVRAYEYDANDNIIRYTETDKSDLGHPDQRFVHVIEYDGLDRFASRTDNVGNRHEYFYDSRDNLTTTSDALRPTPGDPGNIIRYVYDGLNRLTETRYQRTDDGTGAGTPIGEIVTRQEWDDSNRLTAQIDDNGNATRYLYDELDRQKLTVYADGTQWAYTFDPHDNVIRLVDANENDVVSSYDRLNRKIRTDVTVGPGVSDDTTFEIFKYDGLSRLRHAEDDDSLVLRDYDSLSHTIAEMLHGQVTASTYDGVGNQVQCIYPSGRTIACTYDELERKKAISDADGFIAEYFYLGPDRVERRTHGNGTQADYSYDGIEGVPNPVGDFGHKNMIRALHTVSADGGVLEDLHFTWDRMRNKTGWEDATDKRPDRTFAYDSIFRMIESVRQLTDGGTKRIAYEFDGVGNRIAVTTNGVREAYTMSPTLPEPGDAAMNQYTATPLDTRVYDRNGSLIGKTSATSLVTTLTRDFADQLVGVTESAAFSAYEHDALGRRIGKNVARSNEASEIHYFYNQYHTCEERSDTQEITSFVFGGVIDELLTIDNNGIRRYYHTDDLFTVYTLTSGSLIEEYYDYEDFGAPAIFDGLGSPLRVSKADNPFTFTSRRRDDDAKKLYYRTRYFEPALGRFLSRDRVGSWTDKMNVGNALSYIGNNPNFARDPYGEFAPSAGILWFLGGFVFWGWVNDGEYWNNGTEGDLKPPKPIRPKPPRPPSPTGLQCPKQPNRPPQSHVRPPYDPLDNIRPQNPPRTPRYRMTPHGPGGIDWFKTPMSDYYQKRGSYADR